MPLSTPAKARTAARKRDSESIRKLAATTTASPAAAPPKAAVLDTGTHRLVFVVQGEGRFAPRPVELGREAGAYYEVRAGLTAGEQVVTSANFLIDSESRFRAALAAFGGAAAGGHAH